MFAFLGWNSCVPWDRKDFSSVRLERKLCSQKAKAQEICVAGSCDFLYPICIILNKIRADWRESEEPCGSLGKLIGLDSGLQLTSSR